MHKASESFAWLDRGYVLSRRPITNVNDQREHDAERTVSTVSSVRQEPRLGSKQPQPADGACSIGHSQLQTMLTVLTQTATVVSDDCGCSSTQLQIVILTE